MFDNTDPFANKENHSQNHQTNNYQVAQTDFTENSYYNHQK